MLCVCVYVCVLCVVCCVLCVCVCAPSLAGVHGTASVFGVSRAPDHLGQAFHRPVLCPERSGAV